MKMLIDPFIKTNGHDRSPLFLDFENSKRWLNPLGDQKKMLDFLKNQAIRPELTIEIDRPLKAGWDKGQ